MPVHVEKGSGPRPWKIVEPDGTVVGTSLTQAKAEASAAHRNAAPAARRRSRGGAGVMPAKSEEQRRAAAAALAVKRGKQPVSSLLGSARQMFNSMTEKQLRDFAKR